MNLGFLNLLERAGSRKALKLRRQLRFPQRRWNLRSTDFHNCVKAYPNSSVQVQVSTCTRPLRMYIYIFAKIRHIYTLQNSPAVLPLFPSNQDKYLAKISDFSVSSFLSILSLISSPIGKKKITRLPDLICH